MHTNIASCPLKIKTSAKRERMSKKILFLITFGPLLLPLILTLGPLDVKAQTWSSPKQLTFIERAEQPSLSADGSKIAFVGRTPKAWDEVFILDLSSDDLRQLTFKMGASYPSISGDGSKIAFVSNADPLGTNPPWGTTSDSEVFIMNSDGSELRQLTFNQAQEWGVSINYDGSKIAFELRKDALSPSEIFIVNSDGSELRQLTFGMAASSPSISGDGSKVSFESKVDLYVINSDGTGLKQLTSTKAWEDNPSISFDGSKIAFEADLGNQEEIMVINSDSTGLRQLTSNTDWDILPSISGDGSRTAFQHSSGGGLEIFVVNTDGTGLRQLMPKSQMPFWPPSISHNGSRVAFSSSVEGKYQIFIVDEALPLTLSVTVTANPTPIQPGQTSAITTRVIRGTISVSGATVTLSSDKGGTFSAATGNSDSNGYFTSTFTAPVVTTQTTITITASATKTGYLSGQSQTQITVNPSQPQPQPQPQPQQPDLTLWIYIAVVIIVLISIGGGVAIARRRSHKIKA